MKPTTIASIKISAFAALIFGLAAVPVLAAGLVNINTASQAELTSLKGIGSVKAQAVIDYRAGHPFYSIEDIKQVKGIGDATFAAIKDFITVGDIAAPPKAPVTASAPVAAPAAKKSPSAKPTAPKTSSASSYTSQTAAVGASGIPPALPDISPHDTLWTAGLGLAALVVIGVGGALNVRNLAPMPPAGQETTPTAEEFDITTE